MAERRKKITIVGLMISESFQIAKLCAEKLHVRFPRKFLKPEINGLMEVDWTVYLAKTKKDVGGNMWALSRSVAVFFNDKFFGSDQDLVESIGESYYFKVIAPPGTSFATLAYNEYTQYLDKCPKRLYVYMEITINEVLIGMLLFELYADLLPMTCEFFKTLCTNRLTDICSPYGQKGQTMKRYTYMNSELHRVAKLGWIQGGDISGTNPQTMPDESYAISHDRKGILSLANKGKHSNGTQFFITLKPSQWMDYKYVAFGHLIEGLDVIEEIEKLPSYYEVPTKFIEVTNCGVLTVGKELVQIREREESLKLAKQSYKAKKALLKKEKEEMESAIPEISSEIELEIHSEVNLAEETIPVVQMDVKTKAINKVIERILDEVASIIEEANTIVECILDNVEIILDDVDFAVDNVLSAVGSITSAIDQCLNTVSSTVKWQQVQADILDPRDSSSKEFTSRRYMAGLYSMPSDIETCVRNIKLQQERNDVIHELQGKTSEFETSNQSSLSTVSSGAISPLPSILKTSFSGLRKKKQKRSILFDIFSEDATGTAAEEESHQSWLSRPYDDSPPIQSDFLSEDFSEELITPMRLQSEELSGSGIFFDQLSVDRNEDAIENRLSELSLNEKYGNGSLTLAEIKMQSSETSRAEESKLILAEEQDKRKRSEILPAENNSKASVRLEDKDRIRSKISVLESSKTIIRLEDKQLTSSKTTTVENGSKTIEDKEVN